MSFYTELRDTASGLLADKGQTMTLTKRTAGTYDPDTGSAPETTTTSSVIGVALDYPEAQIDGTMILRGDKKVLIQGTSTAPDPDDYLTIGGVVHSVINVKPLSPAGTVVIYTLQVRK